MSIAGKARQADNSDWVDRAASAGLVAFGVVHLVIGWLAVSLALGDAEGSASSDGAVKQLAEQPFGTLLVWLVALGMVLLAIWQLIEAAVGHRQHDDAKRLRKRAVSLGKAVLYAVIAFSALRVATGSGSSGGGTDSTTAKVMQLPGGQVLVGLVGLGVLVVAGFLVRKGVTDRFLRDLDAEGSSGQSGTAYTWLGRVGHVAKGVALAVVAWLFVYAAATHDAEKSGGLDQALREILDQPFGPVLLTAMGVGFACYGLFCFAHARHLSR